MRRILFILLAAASVLPVHAQETEQPRNVILMVADGAGPSAPALARRVLGRPLVLDSYLSGTIATTSTSHEITDSAASATAYACGVRTFKGAIGVDSTGAPCETVLEAAESRGWVTGLVSTAYLADATPGSFGAHAESRSDRNDIAAQMMQQGIEVLLGGGSNHFLPSPDGSREDGRHLLDEARASGYYVISSPAELSEVSVPVIGLFDRSTMELEIDRDPNKEPSLMHMTETALELLKDAEGGFFLLIETEGTDEAAHDNDGAALAKEMESFDNVFSRVVEFARRDGNTLVVALSDHDTGGLGVGRGGSYNWQANVLRNVQRSARWMQQQVKLGEDPFAVFREQVGISQLTETERRRIVDAGESNYSNAYRAAFAAIISERAGIDWSTTGHTEADVFLYSFGPGSELFRGHLQNYEIGQRLFHALGE